MRSIAVLSSLTALLILFSFQTNECGTIPAANKKMAAYLKTKIGKSVGHYCNDLFYDTYKAGGLEYSGYHFGKAIDYSKDCVYPGDVISFKNVEISWKRNDSLVGIKFDQQLDYFIYKVKAKGVYVLARTESIGNKHKVVLTNIEIKKIKGEKPRAYRPSKN